jgi:hypothetical protein
LHFQPASLNENQLTVLIERFVRVSRSRFRWHGNLASSTCRQSVILRSEAYDEPLIGPDKTWSGSAPVVLRTGLQGAIRALHVFSIQSGESRLTAMHFPGHFGNFADEAGKSPASPFCG